MSHANITRISDGLWTDWKPFQTHGALLAVVITFAFFVKSKVDKIVAAWPFITHRDEYMKSQFEKAQGKMFSIKVLHVREFGHHRLVNSLVTTY
jgi:hypothetical protein